jgi:hypothetical protein
VTSSVICSLAVDREELGELLAKSRRLRGGG